MEYYSASNQALGTSQLNLKQAMLFPRENMQHYIGAVLYVQTKEGCEIQSLNNRIPYIGNRPRKKKFANFANLEAFANVFLPFLISARIFINIIA